MELFEARKYIKLCNEKEFYKQFDFMNFYSELCNKIISKYNVCLLEFEKNDSANTMLNIMFDINKFNYGMPKDKNSFYTIRLLINKDVYEEVINREDYINTLCGIIDTEIRKIFEMILKPEYFIIKE